MASIKKKWGNKGNDVLTVTYNGQNPLPQTESVLFSSTQNTGNTVRTLPVTFVSSDKSTRVQRNVVQYTKSIQPPTMGELGVYILHTDGSLYTADQWNTAWNNNAVGVAVLTYNCKFVVAPTENSSTQCWSGDEVLVSGITTATDLESSTTDYKGLQNTDAWVKFYGSNTRYAAGWCRNYTFKNGEKGYLGSEGEWFEVWNYRNAINSALTKCGGSILQDGSYWSSTQLSQAHAWFLRFSDGYTAGLFKADFANRVRAFAAF